MASLNKVMIIGNLTRDPEVRVTSTGVQVAELGMAIDDSYKTQDGDMVEKTVFVDVVLWKRQAEVAQEYLRKGDPVLIEGKLQLDQWETKDGDKRSKMRVRGERMQMLKTKGEKKGGSIETTVHAKPSVDDDDLPF